MIYLIQDEGCLAGLVLLLSNSDQNVIENVLKVLLLLSDTAERKQVLSKFLGLRDQLKLILIRFPNHDSLVCELAKNLTTLLDSADEDCQPRKDNKENQPNSQNVKETTHCKKGFFKVGLGKAKNIVLQVYGMETKEDMELARQGLIGVKGVISITFDLEKKRTHIRAKMDVKADVLANAIISSDPRGNLWADQIVRDDSGNEILVPLVIRRPQHVQQLPELGDSNNQTSVSLPDYLPDSDFDPLNVDPGTNPIRKRRVSAYQNSNVNNSGSGSGWLSVAANYFADKLTTVF